MKEIWKDVAGYEGFYQVSNYGRVRSLSRTQTVNTRYGGTATRRDSGKLINGTSNGNGYLALNLNKGGVRTRRYIHRLVAEAFVNKPEDCDTVNHKDHNRSNNSAENLEWCSQRENVKYSAELMKKEKNNCRKSNTGEKYISMRIRNGKEKYRVMISRLNVCREFYTLDQAVKYRNEVML